MHRKLVPQDELVRLVNERARQLAKGGACALGGVLRLPKPDRDGCNWQEVGIKGIYTEGLLHALRETRAKYNLEDEASER
jgi:hypothetical protein